MTPPARQLGETLDSFGHQLTATLLSLEMHDASSRHVECSAETAIANLEQAFTLGTAPLSLWFREDYLQVGTRPLIGGSLQARQLLELAHQRSIASLTFLSGINAAELTRFLGLLRNAADLAAFSPDALHPALQRHDIHNIQVELIEATRIRPDLPSATDQASVDRAALSTSPAMQDYQNLADCLQRNHVAAFHGDEIAVDSANGAVEQTLAGMATGTSDLLSLASYDDIDNFTVGHSVRVCLLAMCAATASGADRQELLRVGSAALLHDIGKSRIAPEVLFKKGPLDDEEWQAMARHPRLGAEILIEQPGIDPAAVAAAFSHHLAPGCRGYPQPTVPFKPGAISSLVHICDVFEALTAVRPYKLGVPPIEAYTIMSHNPGDFDQRWLNLFVRAIGLYPLGAQLELDDGDHATVIAHGPTLEQPVVRLASTTGPSRIITVGTPSGGRVREITRFRCNHNAGSTSSTLRDED